MAHEHEQLQVPLRANDPTGETDTPVDTKRLQSTANEGQRLIDGAKAAIARALSVDARAFLSANRQTGGQ